MRHAVHAPTLTFQRSDAPRLPGGCSHFSFQRFSFQLFPVFRPAFQSVSKLLKAKLSSAICAARPRFLRFTFHVFARCLAVSAPVVIGPYNFCFLLSVFCFY
jgi:hypothetical protein